MSEKSDLMLIALQQRIGELVSGYETQIALLRAELTELVKEKEEREKAIQDYSDSLPG